MLNKSYIIIGGGIIGLSVAREIANRGLGEVVVLEKEHELGMHASTRNSGVIHSGINQKPGSLKAVMCLEGSKKLRQYCKDNGVKYEECGTIVVARNDQEVKKLYELLDLGKKVGVPDLRIISKEELKDREPQIDGIEALLSPTGAIVDSKNLLETMTSEVKSLGIQVMTDTEVKNIINNKIITNRGEIEIGHIVNCAGLYADKIAHMMGLGLDYSIIPFKGDYVELDIKINSMGYQVPDLRYPFLRVHTTKTMDNKVIGGPTATLSLKGRESYNGEFNLKEFLEITTSPNFLRLLANKEFIKLALDNAKLSLFKHYFLQELNTLLKTEISKDDIKPYKSGIRAQLVDTKGNLVNDMMVLSDNISTHVLNAVSPGLTSSLAFAEYIVNHLSKN